MRSLFCLLGLFVCITGFGQPPSRLEFSSLEMLWDYADAHNIELVGARSNVAVSQAVQQQSRQALLPTITANGSFTDNVKIQPTLIPSKLFDPTAPADSYMEARFGRRYVYNSSLVAQLNLLNTNDWFSIRSARYNQEIASLNLVKTKKAVYEETANLYYSYLLLTAAVRLARANRLSADSILLTAQEKFKEGQVSEVTLNSALINQEKALNNDQYTTQQLASTLNSLKRVLNLSMQDTVRITEQLAPGNLKVARMAADSNPDQAIAFNEWQLAKSNYKAAKYGYLPTLALQYQWNTTVAGDAFLQFGKSNTLQQQYYGLRLSVPILAGGTRHLQVARTRLSMDLSRQQYESVQKATALDYENLLLAYEAARETYGSRERIMQLYAKNDGHAQRQLTEGLISLDKRMSYYSDYITSQQEYLQALSDYVVQYYRIEIRQKALK